MAWLFQLAVECGDDSAIAVRVKSHFDRYSFPIDNDVRGTFTVDAMSQDEAGRWWVSVTTIIGNTALKSTDTANRIEFVMVKLYDRLKLISGYRFAIAGIEPFQFNRIESLVHLLHNPVLDGLVVSKELFCEFGKPREFVNFSGDYLWRPKTLNC